MDMLKKALHVRFKAATLETALALVDRIAADHG
jgi:hypothetical protein